MLFTSQICYNCGAYCTYPDEEYYEDEDENDYYDNYYGEQDDGQYYYEDDYNDEDYGEEEEYEEECDYYDDESEWSDSKIVLVTLYHALAKKCRAGHEGHDRHKFYDRHEGNKKQH